MSTEYSIGCKKCKETSDDVASSSIPYGNKLWTNDEPLKELRDFLFRHVGHELVFFDSDVFDLEDL